jgi:hypothetical protein
MSNREYAKKYANLQSDAQRKYGEIKWEKPFNKLVNEYEIKYGKDWVIPFVSEVSFTKESPSDKGSKVNKQIKQLLKEVKSSPIIKKVKTSKGTKLLKQVQSLATEQEGNKLIKQLESKLKKHASEKDISDIRKMIDRINSIVIKKPHSQDTHVLEMIDEAIKKIPKKTKQPKLMQQAKGYEHKVSDVSPRVQNYVNEYKSIINSGMKQGPTTTAINKLKLKLMTDMKPSEVDDANKLISDFRKTLTPIEKLKKVPKSKTEKNEDNTYEGDKKYKSLTTYVKKHKPNITDPEDIDLIVKELIDKNIPRMSVKKLEEVLVDYGY